MYGNQKKMSAVCVVLLTLFGYTLMAQANKDTSENMKDPLARMLDYSRPGKYHQLLAALVGKWAFKGRHYNGHPNPDSNKVEVEFFGTLVRTPFAYGRFFISDITGGFKIPLPIQDGKMILGLPKGIETEGYDNVKNKYVKTLIGNHLGSDIHHSEGDYDSVKNAIIYQSIVSWTPEMKMITYEQLTFIDKDHYRTEIYSDKGNGRVKESEMNFTRQKSKQQK